MERWISSGARWVAIVLVLLMAGSASAGLQSRAGGQAYYDDVADRTWVATASTSGSPTGLDWFVNHETWIAGLAIDGVGGWRLPSADSDGDGTIVAACTGSAACQDNEMGFLFAANGVSTASPAPFDLLAGAKFIASTVSSGTLLHAFRFDTGVNELHNVATNRIFALAVQTGDVFGAPTATGPNLFTNGSFETGAAIPPGSFISGVGVGNGSITDWSVFAGSVDYIGTLWEASDGARSIDLGGTVAGSLTQTIPTETGHRYRVRFDLAGNYGQAGVKTLRVTAADQLRHFDFDATGRGPNDMGWVTREFEFVARGANTPIYFVAVTPGSFGPALDNVEVVDLGPPPTAPAAGAALETIEVFSFELIANDSGSGADDDGAFHRPLLPPGYFAVAHQGQNHYGAPGQGGRPGASVIAVKPLEPDALAPPASFEWIWNDSGSGADIDAAAFRPIPPPGYRCLSTFMSNDYAFPDVSTHPQTRAALSEFRCVREDLTVPGTASAYVWKDQASGGDFDFSAWRIAPADSAGVGVGGLIGTQIWTTPADPVWVLAASAVRPAALPALGAGPYLELKMSRDRQVVGPCDWDPGIYNDSGTGSDVDVAWWHPQAIPAGFHQLGHTYERFHNPSCSLDPLIVAKALAPGALAPPIGWDDDPRTPAVDPVWTDQGSGGSNNGAIWRPNPPPGYVCLGSFATGGLGYQPPDSPLYASSGHVVNQAVAAAAQNFRCVREDLVVPARADFAGWTDSGSGASRNLAMWEVEPAERVGANAGIDVGHFVGVNAYRLPYAPLHTINARAVAQIGTLSPTEFDQLIAKGPKLRMHPGERYFPDDPIHTLDNDASLCSASAPGLSLPGEGPFDALGAQDSMGEVCDFDIIAAVVPVPYPPWLLPVPLSLTSSCSLEQPNPGPGTFFDAPPQCAQTSATTLTGDTDALLAGWDPVAEPHWTHWLDIDVGALDPATRLPIAQTGDVPVPPPGGGPLEFQRTRVVTRVRPWNGIGSEVQYWVWYPYNGPGKFETGCGIFEEAVESRTAGRHFGDWEVIVLRYDDQLDLAEVYLSRHASEAVLSVKTVGGTLQGGVQGDGLQPIVYSARDSHAHYQSAGTVTYEEPFSLGLGVCTLYLRLYDITGDGPELDLSDPSRLLLASSEFPEIEPDPNVPPDLLRYLGRWGRFEAVGFRGDVYVDGIKVREEGFDDVGKGPTPPILKPVWPKSVPEPASGLAIGIGALVVGALRRRRRASANRA